MKSSRSSPKRDVDLCEGDAHRAVVGRATVFLRKAAIGPARRQSVVIENSIVSRRWRTKSSDSMVRHRGNVVKVVAARVAKDLALHQDRVVPRGVVLKAVAPKAVDQKASVAPIPTECLIVSMRMATIN